MGDLVNPTPRESLKGLSQYHLPTMQWFLIIRGARLSGDFPPGTQQRFYAASNNRAEQRRFWGCVWVQVLTARNEATTGAFKNHPCLFG